jgi:hypothetical protein
MTRLRGANLSASTVAKINGSKLDLVPHKDARKTKRCERMRAFLLDGVAAITAFYGALQREKEPALCSKSERPPT